MVLVITMVYPMDERREKQGGVIYKKKLWMGMNGYIPLWRQRLT